MRTYIKPSTIFWILVTLLPIAGIVLSIIDTQTFSTTQEAWRAKMITFGIYGPLVFILFQAFQVIITPISHYAVGILGGFLYGPYIGGLLNWTGRMIGHMGAFCITRFFGRKIAERYVAPETLMKYDRYVADKSFVLFIFYFLPVFPDDEISYIAGLSKMRFRMFFIANFFGHVGGSLGLAYLGSGIHTRDPLFWGLTVATLICFPLLWWEFKKKPSLGENPILYKHQKKVDLV